MELARIMTRDPVTTTRDTSWEQALATMDDQDIRHLPVVDPGDVVVGVVSDRDLLAALGWVPGEVPANDEREPVGEAREVAEIMHAPVTTMAPDDTVVSATIEMVLSGIGCLPVVDVGQLVGIVTEMDMLMTYWKLAHAKGVPRELDSVVDRHMSEDVRTVAPGTSLADAIDVCRRVHVRHLPVVEAERLVGIVSDRDLRAADGSDRRTSLAIGDIMATQPVTTAVDMPMSEAAAAMVASKISSLPVVDDGRLVGILTLTDLLDHCLSTLRMPDQGRVI